MANWTCNLHHSHWSRDWCWTTGLHEGVGSRGSGKLIHHPKRIMLWPELPGSNTWMLSNCCSAFYEHGSRPIKKYHNIQTTEREKTNQMQGIKSIIIILTSNMKKMKGRECPVPWWDWTPELARSVEVKARAHFQRKEERRKRGEKGCERDEKKVSRLGENGSQRNQIEVRGVGEYEGCPGVPDFFESFGVSRSTLAIFSWIIIQEIFLFTSSVETVGYSEIYFIQPELYWLSG